MAGAVGLFAGVGGVEHGLSQAGFESVLLSEIDPAAAEVLRVRFPAVPVVGDVAEVLELPGEASLLAAGFPCQDLSPPGGKRGIDGLKSGLVSHVFRLARAACELDWVLMENVHFMLKLDGGRAMARLVAMMEEAGFRWAYRTIDALCVVPQRRRRVLVLASRRHDPAEVLFSDDYPTLDERRPGPGEAAGFYWTEGRSGAGLRREAVPTIKVGSGLGLASAPAILTGDDRLGMPTIGDAERLQGFPEGWTSPAEGLSRRVRWRLVGNAVPPPVAKWVAERLRTPRGRIPRGDPLPGRIRPGGPWPEAACGHAGDHRRVDIGESFRAGPRPLLTDFLQDELVPLSGRAIRGFVSRARAGQMRWPDGFLERVEAHA